MTKYPALAASKVERCGQINGYSALAAAIIERAGLDYMAKSTNKKFIRDDSAKRTAEHFLIKGSHWADDIFELAGMEGRRKEYITMIKGEAND